MKPICHPDAELALVAGLLAGVSSDTEACEVFSSVPPAAFHDQRLGVIFAAMLGLHRAGDNPADSRHVLTRLEAMGDLEAAGGKEHVSYVELTGGNGVDVLYWSRLVLEYHRRRQLAKACATASDSLQNPASDVNATALELGAALSQSAMGDDRLESKSVADSILTEIADIAKRYESKTDMVGVPTGFRLLDKVTGGFMPGELTLLAGRPRMGKTSLALGFASNAARCGRSVMFFSLEMSERALCHRLIAMERGISCNALRSPRHMSEAEKLDLVESAQRIHATKKLLRFTARPKLTVFDIRAASQICQMRHGLDLIVVDYLQRIPPAGKSHSREREVAEISLELCAIAKDLNVPVLCLAQLNRQVESQGNHVPNLGHLRESGALEQDADVVLFVHRPSEYETDRDKKRDLEDVGEIHVGKNRNGREGFIEVHWNGAKTLFSERSA